MSEIQTIARLKIHDRKVEEFKRLASQCMEVVRTKDTGTLQYELYFNQDQTECLVLERYRDSQSLMDHHRNIGTLEIAFVPMNFDQLAGFNVQRGSQHQMVGSRTARLPWPASSGCTTSDRQQQQLQR